MKTDTREKIINLIQQRKEISVREICSMFNFSYQAISRQIKKLLNEGILEKHGNAPHVFYSIKNEIILKYKINLPKEDTDFIDFNYWRVNSSGRVELGCNGFVSWCNEVNNKNIEKTATEYIKTLKSYKKYKINGLIDASEKIKEAFKNDCYVDTLYYSDFYSIDRFGKTKLGSMVLYAKQNSNVEIVKNVADLIKKDIYNLIKNKKIDAIAFIPPTIKRLVQFQTEMKKILAIDLPYIELVKIENDIAVPQKTLKKIEDRMENARNTIFLKNTTDIVNYKNILIIDDAVGSGSTINEVSKKIKTMSSYNGKIFGYAIVGSFKGFEILNEI